MQEWAKDGNEGVVDVDLSKIGLDFNFPFHTVDHDEGLSLQLKTFGFREPVFSYHYYNFVDENDRVLDLGANIGYFTILSSNAEKIVAAEPIENLIDTLKLNLENNEILNKTEIINKAVSREDDIIEMNVKEKANRSKPASRYDKEREEIESESLGQIIENYDINLIEMDVEGFEYDLLYENIPHNVNKLAMEFHPLILGIERTTEMLSYFEGEGFTVKYFIEDLPNRLYSFYGILKVTGLMKLFTYVERDRSPLELAEDCFEGRSIKYLILER